LGGRAQSTPPQTPVSAWRCPWPACLQTGVSSLPHLSCACPLIHHVCRCLWLPSRVTEASVGGGSCSTTRPLEAPHTCHLGVDTGACVALVDASTSSPTASSSRQLRGRLRQRTSSYSSTSLLSWTFGGCVLALGGGRPRTREERRTRGDTDGRDKRPAGYGAALLRTRDAGGSRVAKGRSSTR
jgi:hypothetical protein